MALEAALAFALAGPGLFCRFHEAAIDGRDPFESEIVLTLRLDPDYADRAALYSQDVLPRRFQIRERGLWTTFVNDEVLEFGVTAVIQIAADGSATFVTNQQAEAAGMISRLGHCSPAEDG